MHETRKYAFSFILFYMILIKRRKLHKFEIGINLVGKKVNHTIALITESKHDHVVGRVMKSLAFSTTSATQKLCLMKKRTIISYTMKL